MIRGFVQMNCIFKKGKAVMLFMHLFLISQAQLTSDILGPVYVNDKTGEGYFSPLNSIYATAIHAGIFPRYMEKGFHFRLGIHGSRIAITNPMRTYELFHENGSESTLMDVPTLLGENEVKTGERLIGGDVLYPGGMDVRQLTIGMPELYAGTFFGTDIFGRYITIPLFAGLGNLEFYGGGIRHDFGRYFLPEYLKWYVSYSFHELNGPQGFNGQHHYLLTQVGVKLNRMGLYSLAGLEWSRMNYTYEFDGSQQILNLKDNMPFRFGGGFNITFKFFDLYAEYSIMDPNAMLVGFAIGI